MEINYAIVIPVVLVAVLFVAWLVRRNMKDEKKIENEMNQAEIKPEKHDEDQV
jgi:preprotein translocase subunit YajC